MSLDAIRWAWMQTVGRSSAKLVLISLADRADENHSCFPSIERLKLDTELNRKTIMDCLAYLEHRGFVESEKRLGCGSRYKLIGVEGRESRASPKNGTSPKIGTGAVFGTSTKNGTAPVPKTVPPPVPKTGHEPINITNQEPTKGKSRAKSKSKPLDISILPADLSPEMWQEFVTHRNGIKAPITTQTIVEGIVRELEKGRTFGYSPDLMLRTVMEAGWRGVNAEWVKNRLNTAGTPHSASGNADHQPTSPSLARKTNLQELLS